MNTPEQKLNFKEQKKPFSRIGIALVVFLLVSMMAQVIISFIAMWINPSLQNTGFSYSAAMLMSSATMYLIGFPVFYLMVKPLKTDAPNKLPCKASTLIIAFIISVALIYMGQNIGNFIYLAFYEWLHIDLSADVLEIVSEIKWYETFIYSVIFAPLVEEFMFRRLIIDRTRMYGEKLSLIFSALLFALFHMNPQQFFYAFFIGLLLGYLYLRRGKLLPCILLHSTINFFGGVLPNILYKLIDIDKMLEIVAEENIEAMVQMVEENLLGYLLVSAYGFVLMGLSVAGFVLYIIKTRKLSFKKTSEQLPKDSEATVAFTNIGVVLFILFAVIYPLVNAYLSTKV